MENKIAQLQDKHAYLYVFSSIMNNPTILGDERGYPLSVDDFVEPFHKIIFATMKNLYLEGATHLDELVIDGEISKQQAPYEVYNNNQGTKYLSLIRERVTPDNFDMNYNRVKKYSFLRACLRQGIDISDLYDVNAVEGVEKEKQKAKLDSLELEEMVRHINMKTDELTDEFLFDRNNTSGKMSDNAEDILESMLSGQSYGAGFISPYFTSATLGANMGKLFMVSANSGVGKTRWNLGNALKLTVPEYYDKEKGAWVKNESRTGDGALYTGTELEEEEVVEPILCAIAGVDQSDVLEQRVNQEEIERLRKAVGILKETPLYFERLADFDLIDIEHSISKHINKYNVKYVIHDYVHDSSKLMAYFKKIGGDLAEHQRLLMVMTKLKEIAQQYNVFIMTSTQLNANHKMHGALDETAIAGAKAMVNKVDIGAIMSKVDLEEEAIIKMIRQSQPGLVKRDPNLTINIFKSRGTRWNMIRIWTYFDRGTLTMEDQFVTDYKGNVIADLKPLEVMFEEMETVEEGELPYKFQTKEVENVNSPEEKGIKTKVEEKVEEMMEEGGWLF